MKHFLQICEVSLRGVLLATKQSDANCHSERSTESFDQIASPKKQARNDTNPTAILHTVCLLSLIFSYTGCSQPKPKFLTPTEAAEKFNHICKDEYALNIVTRQLGNTLWIYLPFKGHLVDYKASSNPFAKSQKPENKPRLDYIDGKFENKNFNFEYSVNNKNYPEKDRGYSSSYTEEFQTAQRAIYTALARAFGDAKQTVEEHMPEFIVTIITDLEKGLELESILYYDDLKRVSSNPPDLTQEEFLKRYVNDLRGDVDGVNDETGKHIKYREIKFSDFLTRQIVNRINFKFQSSDFPPSQNTKDEMIQIIQETLKAYQFTDYQSIKLKDLSDDSSFVLEKDRL